ncbi:MAG: hypothetical protein HeimC2_10040 [Candidatus Heimdallarchaeota archaeon LC_2]|nr:MAG: hypothetical protein HeimC2_10040 [Candidatus Heimdallarchaeota archaeon LC_2]
MSFLSKLNITFHQINYSVNSSNNLIPNPNEAPNILLSKVSTIPREIISEFEYLQVFDLEDLLELEENNNNNPSIPYIDINKIKLKVIYQSLKLNNIPVLTLEIPNNFAIIAMEKRTSFIDIALTWRGLLFKWMNIDLNEIEEFLEYFNNIQINMNLPELITDTRSWSFSQMKKISPSDLSVYLSNFDIFSSIEDYCNKLQISKYQSEINQHSVINQIYQIEFILWYAMKMKN